MSADTDTIAHLHRVVKTQYAEIADLRAELGELRKAMGGWGPAIAVGLEDVSRQERERKAK